MEASQERTIIELKDILSAQKICEEKGLTTNEIADKLGVGVKKARQIIKTAFAEGRIIPKTIIRYDACYMKNITTVVYTWKD